jgi:hypothetical protein
MCPAEIEVGASVQEVPGVNLWQDTDCPYRQY